MEPSLSKSDKMAQRVVLTGGNRFIVVESKYNKHSIAIGTREARYQPTRRLPIPDRPRNTKTLEAEALAPPGSHHPKRSKRHFWVVWTDSCGIPDVPKDLAVKARNHWSPSPNEDYLDPAPNEG